MNFSFLNPLALWALPLALSPVLLHLFFRRPPKIAEFGDLKLLARVAEKTKPRKKIRQWLILLARFLTLFSLFFFFSKPILHFGAAAAAGDGAALVILLDHSYSMQVNPSGISRWDQALLEAEKALNALDEGDRSALIAFSDRIDFDSQSLTNRHDELIASLKGLKPGYGGTQVLPALERAYKMLGNSAASNRCILILTDGARHGWVGGAGTPGEADPFRDWSAMISGYDPAVKVLISEPARKTANVSINSVELTADAASGLAKYRVIVKNWGAKALTRWPVSLETIEGARVTESLVDLAPEESKSLFLTASLPEGPSGMKGSVRTDALEADDSFFIVQNPHERIRILVAEDYAGTAAISGETYFFRQALKSGPSPFEIRTVTLGQLKKTRLADYRVLVLADPSEIDRDLGDQLRKFVAAGGSLFITLGERHQTQTLAEISDLLPCLLEGGREVQGLSLQPSLNLPPDRLDMAQYESDKIEVRNAVGAQLKPDAVSWMYFADGSPLLAFTRDQKVALWLSTVDRSWNNFASKPLYAPLMRAVVESLAQKKQDRGARGLWVGETYQGDLPDGASPNDWFLADQKGERVPLAFRDGKLRSDPLARPGLYALAKNGQNLKSREWVAVNTDRAKEEGNLSPISLKECQKILPESNWVFLRGGDPFLADFLRVLRGRDLTRVFAAAAGLFLLCEMSLLYRRKSG